MSLSVFESAADFASTSRADPGYKPPYSSKLIDIVSEDEEEKDEEEKDEEEKDEEEDEEEKDEDLELALKMSLLCEEEICEEENSDIIFSPFYELFDKDNYHVPNTKDKDNVLALEKDDNDDDEIDDSYDESDESEYSDDDYIELDVLTNMIGNCEFVFDKIKLLEMLCIKNMIHKMHLDFLKENEYITYDDYNRFFY
jgi:hypothetical protein